MKKIFILLLLLSYIPASSSWADSNIAYGPYIQNIDIQRATIIMKTDSSEILTLYYKRANSKKWKKVTDSSASQTHRYRLLGLKKNTSYQYYLSGVVGDLTQKYFFNTNHDISKNNPLTVAAVGDFSLLNEAQLQIVSQMIRIHPDIILGLGDCAYDYGTLEEFDYNFLSPYQSLLAEVPMYATMGNHDYITENGGPYKEVFEFPTKSSGTEDYYIYSYDDVQMFSLNANLDYSIGSSQYNWMQSELAKSNSKWKIVLIHFPPYSSGPHGNTENMANSLIPLFDQYQVDLVLSGHDHGYERSLDSSDVAYIVSGGGGSPLYTQENTNYYSQFYLSAYNFTNIIIYPGKLVIQGIDQNGYIFDRLSLKK